MKIFLKNSLIFLLFLFAFVFKEKFYSLINAPKEDYSYLKDNELQYYKDEYIKLLNQYDLNLNLDRNYVYSKIIYRNIYDFFYEMVISNGENKHYKVGDCVVSTNGLVGIISKVNKNSSNVSLLYNSDLKLSIRVNDSFGILKSQNNKLIVNNITNDSDIKIGDLVYTSGLTNIIKDIPIGTVSKVDVSSDNLEKILEIKMTADYNNLDYVVVITSEE